MVASAVHAEGMSARGPERRAEGVGEIRILDRWAGQSERRDHQRREDRHEDQQHDEDGRGHCHPVGAKAPPEQLQGRTRGDLARGQLDGVECRVPLDEDF
jgi:hypothetical protein